MRILFGLILGLMLVAPGLAQRDISSAYTKFDLDNDCTIISQYELGASFECEGFEGQRMVISEGDLRFFVAYGDNAEDERAHRQTIPFFNNLNPTIEWRLVDGSPFASIYRLFTDISNGDGSGKQGQVLVVTRMEAGNMCHVAYIDALANKQANVLARQAADHIAPHFDCESSEPVVYGVRGNSF